METKRLIEVVFSGHYVFSEDEIIEAFSLDDHPTNIDLLEYAEMLIDNLDSETLIKQAYIEANFLYDYEGDELAKHEVDYSADDIYAGQEEDDGYRDEFGNKWECDWTRP